MNQDSGLTIRQHRRREIDLPIEFIVSDEHQSQVRFSAAAGTVDQHAVTGRSLDISPGGIGLTLSHFLPRMCEGVIRVFDPKPVDVKRDGTPVLDVAFEHRAKVRRVQMTDPAPKYFVGVAFVDAEANLDEQLGALFDRVNPSVEGIGDA